MRGGGAGVNEGVTPAAPPGFSKEETALTFVGTFLTISALTWLNTHLVSHHNRNHAAILLGPFGALVTLLYGLTAAPASQPRNAILGQLISVGIVLLLQYIPHWENVSLEWRAALSTALAVSAMVYLGITHPPAGASAFLFALNPQSWKALHLGVLLMANIVAIGIAIVVNNISDRRQYPTFYYGLDGHWLYTWITSRSRTQMHENNSNQPK
jgi:CBS-domain-containing membrane protein